MPLFHIRMGCSKFSWCDHHPAHTMLQSTCCVTTTIHEQNYKYKVLLFLQESNWILNIMYIEYTCIKMSPCSRLDQRLFFRMWIIYISRRIKPDRIITTVKRKQIVKHGLSADGCMHIWIGPTHWCCGLYRHQRSHPVMHRGWLP